MASLFAIAAVVFHVSPAYVAVGITIDAYKRSFTVLLMLLDDQIGRSLWKTDAAFPILARRSTIASPSLEM